MKFNYLLILLFISMNSFAQKYSLLGHIADLERNSPVAYANISILNQDSSLITGAIADSTGNFLITDLRERIILVKVQSMGYQSNLFLKEIPEGIKDFNVQTIYLTIDPALLNEVIIKGEKSNSVIEIDKQVIDATQFQTATGGTGLDVLKNIASVTVDNEGNVSLRGSEGFIVLINGKPTNRTPADVLSQIPANEIARIELITSPSAKYDAEGKAGIINIITNKEIAPGWSINTNGFFGGTDPLRTGGDIAFNYGKAKWNFYAGGDFRRYDFDGYRYGNTRTILNDTLTYLYSEGIRNYIEFDYAGQAGINFNPDKMNSFNIGIYAGFKESDRQASLHYTEYYKISPGPDLFEMELGDPKSYFFNENLFVRTGEFYTGNFDFTHTFSNKSAFSILTLYEYSILGGPLTQKETDETNNEIILNERSTETNPLNGLRLQADYSLPLQNLQFETGIQLRTLHHTGNFNFERQDLITGIWNNVSDFTDTLDLHQNIFSGYVQFNGKKNKFNYALGLRTEYTDRSLEHTLEPDPYLYNKLDLFPSVQGLWELKNNQTLRLAYNRRIDRPTTRLMAPFKNHRHTESIEVGDPNLIPEIADIAEFTYSKQFKKTTLTTTAYFNNVTNKIFRLNDVYNRHTLIRTYTNAGNTISTGIELTANIKLTSWWKLYAAGNLYVFRVNGEIDDEPINNESVNYTVKGNTTFQITKQVSLQWDANYISETVTAIGTDGALFLSNASIKYNFMNNNAYVGIKAQNIFNSNDQVFITEGDDFYSSIEFIKYDSGLLFILGFNLNDFSKDQKTIKTDYGEKDF